MRDEFRLRMVSSEEFKVFMQEPLELLSPERMDALRAVLELSAGMYDLKAAPERTIDHFASQEEPPAEATGFEHESRMVRHLVEAVHRANLLAADSSLSDDDRMFWSHHATACALTLREKRQLLAQRGIWE